MRVFGESVPPKHLAPRIDKPMVIGIDIADIPPGADDVVRKSHAVMGGKEVHASGFRAEHIR